MNIKAIYDNGGKSFDRYTVYYNEKEADNCYGGRAMSDKPFHPQGFGQYISGQLGKQNGKRIQFDALPNDCKALIESDLNLLPLS